MNEKDDCNSEKKDDFGTLFYKLRNGNLPFEYDTEIQLKKISKIIDRNNKDITCGLISAIVANYVDRKGFFSNKEFVFLIFLFMGYFCLKVFFFVSSKLYEEISKFINSKRINEIDEEEIQDFFYKKIVVQTTYAFSVIKRSKNLENDNTKKELYDMYIIQGVYGIRKVGVELSKIVYTASANKLKKYIEAIGKERLVAVINILMHCVNDIEKLADSYNSDISSDKKRLDGLMEKINGD